MRGKKQRSRRPENTAIEKTQPETQKQSQPPIPTSIVDAGENTQPPSQEESHTGIKDKPSFYAALSALIVIVASTFDRPLSTILNLLAFLPGCWAALLYLPLKYKGRWFAVFAFVATLTVIWLVYPKTASKQPEVPLNSADVRAGTSAPSPTPTVAQMIVERKETTTSRTAERKPTPPAQKTQSEKGRTPINQTMKDSPGGVQQIMKDSPGGIQVSGDLNLNNIPEPKFSLRMIRENEPFGDEYKTEFTLIIDSKVQVPNLYLEVEATTNTNIITSLNVVSIGRTWQRLGHTSRPGHRKVFTNLPNAFGSYLITFTSKAKDTYKVGYDH